MNNPIVNHENSVVKPNSLNCYNRDTKSGIFLQPNPLQIELARIIGKFRTIGHNHCRTVAQDLGDRKNRRVDCYAALAETLVIDALYRSGLMPEGYEALLDKARRGPDFVLNGIGYDIKSVPLPDRVHGIPCDQYLRVNEGQRLDPAHNCAYVLPAVFVSGHGRMTIQVMEPVSIEAVGSWPLREGHSLYRSIAVSKLKPLPGWMELPGGAK